jgi:hypothetical protein
MTLSATMDVVAADGVRRVLAEQDVRTIRMTRPDPLGDGAKIGFAVGAGPAGKATLRIAPVLGPKVQGARLSVSF